MFRLPTLMTLVFTLVSANVFADAPLTKKLDLTPKQASEVAEIQKSARKVFAAKRQAYQRQNRALRRARAEHQSQRVSELEMIVARLGAQMRAIRDSENASIRKILSAEQNQRFDQVLRERREMVGSSRDARVTGS